MVRTPGFHPEDPGSIPHAGDFFKILILIHIFNLVPIVWAPHIIAFNTVCIGGKFICKKNLQDLLSSLNAVISTNESTQIITSRVIYNPAYIYKFQLKTT